MRFEWDDVKRAKNLERHALDFLDIGVVFSGPLIVGDAKIVGGEPRLLATGRLDELYVTAIYTMRDDVVRIISLRRARRDERSRHQELHGG